MRHVKNSSKNLGSFKHRISFHLQGYFLIAAVSLSNGYYLGALLFYNSKNLNCIGALSVFTTRRGVMIFYRFFFFLAESKFVHDLNFDFFLFEHLPPFLIVDFCFRTLDFNNSLVCKV